VLRRAAYDGAGGAIARLAEDTYRKLSEPQRAAARRTLLRLAHAGQENDAFVRRRVPLDELDATAVEALADGRLVTLDEGTAEVAHEALLREWPRLRGWLEEDAAGRRLHQHLIHAARDWEAAGREESELYRGARLTSALDWLGEHQADLNERERAFVAASRAAAERESERQQQANRRLRVLIGGLGCLLALAVVTGVVALDQRGEARQASVVADAQRLGAQAQAEDRLDRALLLARAGVALDDTIATRGSLLSVLERNPAALGVVDYGWGLFSVAISRDSRLMASGDERGAVNIYNPATHQPIGRPYWVRSGLIQHLRFSPDGRTLALGAIDPSDKTGNALVDLIDPRTQQLRRRIHLGPLPPRAQFGVALPEFVTGGDLDIEQVPAPAGPDEPASVVYHVDTETGAIQRSRPVGRHASTTFSVTADGRRVFLTNPLDNTTWMLDATTLRVRRSYPVGAGAGAVSADGRYFALGSADGHVRLLDTGTSAVRAFADGDGQPISDMRFTPDGRKLVTGSADGTLLVWDVRQGAVVETLTGHTQEAEAMDVSGDGRTLVSGSRDGRVMVFDLAGNRRLERPFASGGPYNVDQTPRGLAISPDGRTLAFTRSDGGVQLLDARTLRPERRLQALRGFAAGVAYSPDGRLMAVVGEHGQVTLFDARTRQRVRALRGLRGTDQSLAFSPNSRLLAAGEQEPTGCHRRDPATGRVYECPVKTLIWDVRSGRPTAFRHAGTCKIDDCSASSLAFSPDGSEIAAAQDVAGADVLDAHTGRLIKHLTTGGEARSIAFSPDGKLVVVGRYDGKGFMFSTATWQRVGRPLDANNARITYAVFTPDSRTLATADADGTVRLWDVATHKAIGGPFDFDVSTFPAAAFSPDGRDLYAISSTGEGIRFDMSPAVWNRDACRIAGREMTAQEWQDALPGRPYRRLCAA
jgi:WD40 repeat protein